MVCRCYSFVFHSVPFYSFEIICLWGGRSVNLTHNRINYLRRTGNSGFWATCRRRSDNASRANLRGLPFVRGDRLLSETVYQGLNATSSFFTRMSLVQKSSCATIMFCPECESGGADDRSSLVQCNTFCTRLRKSAPLSRKRGRETPYGGGRSLRSMARRV